MKTFENSIKDKMVIVNITIFKNIPPKINDIIIGIIINDPIYLLFIFEKSIPSSTFPKRLFLFKTL